MAAIAGALRPKKLVAINVANVVRLVVTAAGCTVAACATSNAVAAARAWTPAEAACPDAAVSHPTYGAAAAAIDADAGPAHGPAVNPTITDNDYTTRSTNSADSRAVFPKNPHFCQTATRSDTRSDVRYSPQRASGLLIWRIGKLTCRKRGYPRAHVLPGPVTAG